jgi:hypothetical protein
MKPFPNPKNAKRPLLAKTKAGGLAYLERLIVIIKDKQRLPQDS